MAKKTHHGLPTANQNRWGDDDDARALVLAHRYLRYGVRSGEELRAHLRERGVNDSLIQSAVERCGREGLLDDRACATLWAVRLADQGYAASTIRERLLAKGLHATLLHGILASLHTASDADRARLLVRDRLRSLDANLKTLAQDRSERATRVEGRRGARCDPRLRRRLARLLAQRGFDPDLIDQILNESLGAPSQ